MRIDIITLFPDICRAPLNESMMKRAQENGALDLHIHNLRAWTSDKHHVVDDAPFGGGQGMVMKPEPIFAAVEDLQKTRTSNIQRQRQTVAESHFDVADRAPFRSTNGEQNFHTNRHLIIVCGHYEGVDHRVVDHLIDRGNIHRRLCADERRDRSCDSG